MGPIGPAGGARTISCLSTVDNKINFGMSRNIDQNSIEGVSGNGYSQSHSLQASPFLRSISLPGRRQSFVNTLRVHSQFAP